MLIVNYDQCCIILKGKTGYIYSSEQKDQNNGSNERKSSITSFMKTIKPSNFQKKILDSMGNEMGNWFSEQTIYSQFLTQLTKPNL